MTTLKQFQTQLTDRFILVPVDRLVAAPWNFKVDDASKSEKLVNSLKATGQIANCNVRELGDGEYTVVTGDGYPVATGDGLYELVDGNHRLPAFIEIGDTYAVCYNHGAISEAEAIKIAHSLMEAFEVDIDKQAAALQLAMHVFPIEEIANVTPASTLPELSRIATLSDFDFDAIDGSKIAEEGDDEDVELIQFVFAGENHKLAVEAAIDRVVQLRGLSKNDVGRGEALMVLCAISTMYDDDEVRAIQT